MSTHIRCTQYPVPEAVLRIRVTRDCPLFHVFGSERSNQHRGVCCLRRPVAERVRDRGGSSRGSRLSGRALGGIAVRFARFLATRHLTE